MSRKNPEVSMKSTKIKPFNWRRIVKAARRFNKIKLGKEGKPK